MGFIHLFYLFPARNPYIYYFIYFLYFTLCHFAIYLFISFLRTLGHFSVLAGAGLGRGQALVGGLGAGLGAPAGPWPRQQQIKGLPRVPSPNARQYFKKSGQIGRVSFERQRGIQPGPGPRPGGWAGPGAAPGARTWRRTGPRPAPGPGPARPAPDLRILAI